MREKPPSVRELTRRVRELETALEHALQIATAERSRADANEQAYRRAIRVSLCSAPSIDADRIVGPPQVQTRTCAAPDCRRRLPPRPPRPDQAYCSGRCLKRHWKQQRRRAQRAQDVQEARTA